MTADPLRQFAQLTGTIIFLVGFIGIVFGFAVAAVLL